jgi:hypothetical protein
MNVGRVIAACALLCAWAKPGMSQTPQIRAELHGRMHYQWNTTSVGAGETASGAAIAPSTFEHRRVRLSADVQVSDWIHGRVEPEFAMGQLRLRNAWVALAVDPAVTFRAGQFKKPFNAIFLTSGSEIPLIERSVRIRGLDAALRQAVPGTTSELRGELLIGEAHALLEAQRYASYDMGAAVEAHAGVLGISAGVFNGQGADTRDEDAGVSAAARATVTADVGAPLTFGAGWSRRSLNWPVPASTDSRAGNAFVADVQLGGYRRGLWLIAEAVTGDNLVTEERLTGAQAMLAWYRPLGHRRIEGVEPVARASWGDPDNSIEGDEGVLLTPGINFYFAGRNRLMVNWDVYVPGGDGLRTQHAVRAQINLEF